MAKIPWESDSGKPMKRRTKMKAGGRSVKGTPTIVAVAKRGYRFVQKPQGRSGPVRRFVPAAGGEGGEGHTSPPER